MKQVKNDSNKDRHWNEDRHLKVIRKLRIANEI